MDAGEALDELNRLSAEIRCAAILGDSGALLAATSAAAGERLARTAVELLDVAAVVDPGRTVERLVVELAAGSLFVVRADGHVAAATTGPEPPAALVVHDLRTCLERLAPLPATSGVRGPQADPADA